MQLAEFLHVSRQRLVEVTMGQTRVTRTLLHRDRIARYAHEKLVGRVDVVPSLTYEYAKHFRCQWDAIYHRTKKGIHLEVSIHCPWAWEPARRHSPTYIYWLLSCPPEVQRLPITLSDGDSPTEVVFAPSTSLPHVVPIPDPYFWASHGWRDAEAQSRSQGLPWHDRSSTIVWRGSSSGMGTYDPILGGHSPALATERLLLCLALLNVPDTDAGVSALPRREVAYEVLEEHGIGRPPIPEASWLGRKFAIDIDGQTNTWSNLIVRLHYGCCVLKVQSRSNYRQWYYDRLRPWEHYVPVKPDQSDLLEKIDWVRSNDAEASRIAARGQAFARSLDWASVRQEAIDLITTHWDKPYVPVIPPQIHRAGDT